MRLRPLRRRPSLCARWWTTAWPALLLACCTQRGALPVGGSASAASTRSVASAAAAASAPGPVAGLSGRPGPSPHAYQPPPYADAAHIAQRALTVGSAPFELPATLTVPRGARRCPAVVLVHGSGPHDRDETIGPNKPFADLALGLGSRGVCVLRYEKRTKRYPREIALRLGERLTLREETIDDAVAAVAAARVTAPVDPAAVFVLGHSLGATAMPRIARAASAARGFILMAGASMPLQDTILRQMRYVTGLDGEVSDEERQILTELEQQVARVKTLGPNSKVAASGLPLSIPAAYWLDLAAHPPAGEMAAERRPVLVLQGGRDYQVVEADLDGWRRALARHPDATFKRYPALNHLMMAGRGPSGPTEYDRPGHVAAEVIDDVARFVAAHAR